MDRIVFDQEQLNAAVSQGAGSVLLCDNKFDIPIVPNVCYRALGDVSAYIALTRSAAEEKSISFADFEPEYSGEDKPFYANIPQRTVSVTSSYAGSYSSSFASSYAGSYSSSFASSFRGSFTWKYEYELGSSFSGSNSGSYTGSFDFSFMTSFSGSYTGSFDSSFMTSFSGSFFGICVPVFGYGIDLI